jgi:hypothetical protein
VREIKVESVTPAELKGSLKRWSAFNLLKRLDATSMRMEVTTVNIGSPRVNA